MNLFAPRPASGPLARPPLTRGIPVHASLCYSPRPPETAGNQPAQVLTNNSWAGLLAEYVADKGVK